MSSILKALKKLEEEKTLHEESTGINVSREILKQSSGNRQIVRWIWLLGSAATIVIIILTVALMRKSRPNEVLQSAKLPIANQSAPPALQLQNLPVSPDLTRSDKNNSPAPPSSASEHKPGISQQSAEKMPVNQIIMEKIDLPNTTNTITEPPKPAPTVKAVPTPPTASSEQTLTLSGIAWNKDSADRLAIINGQPTASGATVNGVNVVEILQDRVKLSHNGRIFELLIGRNARTD